MRPRRPSCAGRHLRRQASERNRAEPNRRTRAAGGVVPVAARAHRADRLIRGSMACRAAFGDLGNCGGRAGADWRGTRQRPRRSPPAACDQSSRGHALSALTEDPWPFPICCCWSPADIVSCEWRGPGSYRRYGDHHTAGSLRQSKALGWASGPAEQRRRNPKPMAFRPLSRRAPTFRLPASRPRRVAVKNALSEKRPRRYCCLVQPRVMFASGRARASMFLDDGAGGRSRGRQCCANKLLRTARSFGPIRGFGFAANPLLYNAAMIAGRHRAASVGLSTPHRRQARWPLDSCRRGCYSKRASKDPGLTTVPTSSGRGL